MMRCAPLLLVLLAASPAASLPEGTTPAQACAVDGPPDGEFFPGIAAIKYEGPDSPNPLAFKWYNASEEVAGRPMSEWLRFSLAFWHSLRGDGSDPFGSPTKSWPWENPALGEMALARRRLGAFFELAQKLGVQFWCFHDRDISPEGATLEESHAALDAVAAYAARLQAESGVRLLWGTAQLFKHRRYMHGAATSPNATVFAHAAAQVKQAMEVTHRLGGLGYVFWGGREGYSTLLNTDMALETANMARFLRMAAAHARGIGFKGALMLEPKPREPAKHQYDYDAATTHAFLLRHGLVDVYRLNIECNHATLAGHSCSHELEYASQAGLLASLDANTGDPQLGWDTDEFLTDPREAALVAGVVLRQGGLPLGINFDAKLRRESTDPADLFIAHIGGMDALARGLRAAAAARADGRLAAMKAARYSSYTDTQLGRDILAERVGFEALAQWALASADPGEGLPSGKQELFEMIFNQHLR